MSYEEGMRLIASYERVGVMWIYADGRCMKSPFFEAACIKE